MHLKQSPEKKDKIHKYMTENVKKEKFEREL